MLGDFSKKCREHIAFFQTDIGSLRTGRAAPSVVEAVRVNAYGSLMPLVQLASISVSDARTIVIQPWDKSLLKDIEQAIRAGDLNVSPVVDESMIRISLPQLTEENRLALVKQLHQKAEQAKVSIRQQREKTRVAAQKAADDGELPDDQKFKLFKDIDDAVKNFNDEIKKIADAKEQEIMTI